MEARLITNIQAVFAEAEPTIESYTKVLDELRYDKEWLPR